MNTCSACGNSALWEMHLNGTASCRNCGLLVHNERFVDPGADNFLHSFQSMSVLHQTQTYTRAKRFKKYLNRACMRQSVNSVPDATWKYLLDHTRAFCAGSSRPGGNCGTSATTVCRCSCTTCVR